MAMSRAMSMEQTGSAIIRSYFCMSTAEMMTPTLPRVSAMMCRRTPGHTHIHKHTHCYRHPLVAGHGSASCDLSPCRICLLELSWRVDTSPAKTHTHLLTTGPRGQRSTRQGHKKAAGLTMTVTMTAVTSMTVAVTAVTSMTVAVTSVTVAMTFVTSMVVTMAVLVMVLVTSMAHRAVEEAVAVAVTCGGHSAVSSATTRGPTDHRTSISFYACLPTPAPPSPPCECPCPPCWKTNTPTRLTSSPAIDTGSSRSWWTSGGSRALWRGHKETGWLRLSPAGSRRTRAAPLSLAEVS